MWVLEGGWSKKYSQISALYLPHEIILKITKVAQATFWAVTSFLFKSGFVKYLLEILVITLE